MISTLDHLLADEAMGVLDPARSLLVASLASMRPEISIDIARYEAAGGALLAAVRPVPLREDGFERLSILLQAEPRAPASAPELGFAELPAPLRGTVAAALRKGTWRRLLPGVHALDLSAVLPRARGGQPVLAELLRVYPGWAIPRHGHGGEELTLVLAGGFTDETGHFKAGDIAIVDPALTHRPLADPGEPCLSFIVSDTAPRFTGPLGALTRAWHWFRG